MATICDPKREIMQQRDMLAAKLLAIFNAADHSDAGLYNVVKQTELQDAEFPRDKLEEWAGSVTPAARS
jgi:hypothetical protein